MESFTFSVCSYLNLNDCRTKTNWYYSNASLKGSLLKKALFVFSIVFVLYFDFCPHIYYFRLIPSPLSLMRCRGIRGQWLYSRRWLTGPLRALLALSREHTSPRGQAASTEAHRKDREREQDSDFPRPGWSGAFLEDWSSCCFQDSTVHGPWGGGRQEPGVE